MTKGNNKSQLAELTDGTSGLGGGSFWRTPLFLRSPAVPRHGGTRPHSPIRNAGHPQHRMSPPLSAFRPGTCSGETRFRRIKGQDRTFFQALVCMVLYIYLHSRSVATDSQPPMLLLAVLGRAFR